MLVTVQPLEHVAPYPLYAFFTLVDRLFIITWKHVKVQIVGDFLFDDSRNKCLVRCFSCILFVYLGCGFAIFNEIQLLITEKEQICHARLN